MNMQIELNEQSTRAKANRSFSSLVRPPTIVEPVPTADRVPDLSARLTVRLTRPI